MRKRPETLLSDAKEQFIKSASSNEKNHGPQEDLHRYVKPTIWPFTGKTQPSLASSGHFTKSFRLTIKKFEWDAVERHVKSLGIQKSTWIRHAIFKLMEEEQLFFLKQKHEKPAS